MYRIDVASALTGAAPGPTAPGPNPQGFFQGGDPIAGTAATIVEAEWLNMLQEEVANCVEAYTPLLKNDRFQLLGAVRAAAAAGGVGVFVLVAGDTMTGPLRLPSLYASGLMWTPTCWVTASDATAGGAFAQATMRFGSDIGHCWLWSTLASGVLQLGAVSNVNADYTPALNIVWPAGEMQIHRPLTVDTVITINGLGISYLGSIPIRFGPDPSDHIAYAINGGPNHFIPRTTVAPASAQFFVSQFSGEDSVPGTPSARGTVFHFSNLAAPGTTGSTIFADAGSDIALKQNVQPSKIDALSIVNSVDIVEFDWIADGSHAAIGVVANQAREHIPEAFYDALKPDGTREARINDQGFSPYMLRAIQQLTERLSALEAR